MFLQGKVKSARYIAQVLNHVLLPFLRQEIGVLFQQDIARPRMASATQRVLPLTTALATKIPRSVAN